jgi:hypothetical protein
MSFAGHRPVLPNISKGMCKVTTLSDEQLNESHYALVAAARAMGRRIPSSTYVKKLLQRDYWIIRDVDAVIAIGNLHPKGLGLGVDGGTGWGCEMYFDRVKRDGQPLSLMLYDQESKRWYKCQPDRTWTLMDWFPVLYNKRYALIGSRTITEDGMSQIRSMKRLS